MKKLKKLVSVLAAALLLAALPHGSMLTVYAAGTTFYVFYDSDDDQWYYQRDTSSRNIDIEQKEAFQLKDVISDGDIVVVEGRGNQNDGLTLDVSKARLSNLTLKNAATVVIHTNGIDECYVLDGTVAAVNGNVTNAYVYDKGSVTFNNNIGILNITRSSGDIRANVSCSGTVDYVSATDEHRTRYECFNVAAGRLSITNGTLDTDEAYYSKTGSVPAAPSEPTPQPAPSAKPAQAAQNAAKPSASEYDDVPKTGESAAPYLWLLGTAALCFAGKLALKKSSR